MQAGTHLIIVDDLSCRGSPAAKSSNPKILNYYRQFLVKGFGDLLVELQFSKESNDRSKVDQSLLTAIKMIRLNSGLKNRHKLFSCVFFISDYWY